MAAVSLVPADLAPFASIDEAMALEMIADVLARAARVAPCITAADFQYAAAAKAILRGVVLRWHETGGGSFTQETLGNDYSYTTDSRQQRKSLFWPSEIQELQSLCRDDSASSGAFAVDTVGIASVTHADICARNFGALYCSCGAELTLGFPLWEVS